MKTRRRESETTSFNLVTKTLPKTLLFLLVSLILGAIAGLAVILLIGVFG